MYMYVCMHGVDFICTYAYIYIHTHAYIGGNATQNIHTLLLQEPVTIRARSRYAYIRDMRYLQMHDSRGCCCCHKPDG